VNETGAPRGTLVSVSQLFFNTPARRKFLKTVNTEMGHIADVVAGMALGRPEVHFNLTHNGKRVKQWPKAGDAVQRAAGVLGQPSTRELIPLDARHGDLTISGFLAPARLSRKTSRSIYLYVNGRRVRDRAIQHALFEGYHGRLVKGQFPLAVLFITLPYDAVDVNVHPTKHEIRFADQRRVHRAVQNDVAAALNRDDRKLWGLGDRIADTGTASEPEMAYVPRNRPTSNPFSDKSAQPFVYQTRSGDADPAPPSDAPGPPIDPPPGDPLPMEPPAAAGPPAQPGLWAAERFADLTVIGQVHGTYVVCQNEQGMILIDQHAAHERIVYEELKQGAGRIDAQRLLMPETVELGFAEAQLLEQLAPQLNRMGLELEPFGGNTFVVKTVPVVLDDRDITGIVVEIADRASRIGMAAGLDRILDECRMVMACHNAVRAHQRLSPEQIAHMLARLDRCENPSHCPHGRPTWIHFSLNELEKRFKRIIG
jgi:DNA mismatch repair protein MutL